MGKSTHFSGQPLYSQVINLLDRSKILQISQQHDGERYVKSFNCWSHLVVMLYAVIMRFDSLREISTSMLAEARKLVHLRLVTMPRRSTLADANKRRPEAIFEEIYRSLYTTYHSRLCSDSRSRKTPKWMKRLQIIDSTTISLFSNLIFKGVGRHPKIGKKKGGIKVHTVIHANEGIPSDIKFTSAATNDSFMLRPGRLSKGDIVAMDRAYINYEKFEELTQRGVNYYYGYKLHAICGLSGVIHSFDLTKASVHDINYLKNIKYEYHDCSILGDRGYISKNVQLDLFETANIRLEVPYRLNQKDWSPTFIPFAKARKRIETDFSQLCDQFMIVRNYAKDTVGLFTRILGKISAFTILQYINHINNKPIGRLKYALI